jgi:hypothetical protein
MFKWKKILFPAILLLFFVFGKAQTSLVFYHLNNQFNASNYNPAFLTGQNQFSFSFFPLGGSSVIFDDQKLIRRITDMANEKNFTDDFYIEIMNTISDRSLINQNLESTLLTANLQTKIGNFNFRVNEKGLLSIAPEGSLIQRAYDNSLITFPITELQRLPAEASHYREYSLAYARSTHDNKLSYGMRAKLIFGKSSIDSELEGRVHNTSGIYTFNSENNIQISYPGGNESPRDHLGKYLFHNKNIGLAVDLGLFYKPNSEVTLSISLLDFGRIKWNSNLQSRNLENILLNGVSETGGAISFNPNEINIVELFQENLEKTANQTSYRTPLPRTIFAGADYRISQQLRLGLVDRYISSEDFSQNSMSLTANFAFNSKFTIVSGYSIIGERLINLPFAFQYNWKFGQSYLGTDNLVSFFAPASDGVTALTFGTCFYIFTRQTKYKDPLKLEPFHREKKAKPRSRSGLIDGNWNKNIPAKDRNPFDNF